MRKFDDEQEKELISSNKNSFIFVRRQTYAFIFVRRH
jgi:hypothetical protein